MKALFALAIAAIATTATAAGTPQSRPVDPYQTTVRSERERPETITVSVDFSALSSETSARIDALTLESRVVLRLIEEGFAVAAPYKEPDVRVRLVEQNGAVALTATGGGGEETGTVGLGGGTAKELQLEIAQKIVELSRSRVAAVQRARDAANAPTPLRKNKEPEVTPAVPEPLTLELSLGAGALWRSFGPDPMATLSFSVQNARNVGVGLWLAYDKPTGPDLVINEFEVAVGPRLGILRSAWWDVDVGLAAGAFAHAFEYTGTAPGERTGYHITFVGLVPVSIRLKLGQTFRVGLQLSPGWGIAQEQRADNQPIWQRGPSRLESSLAASAVF